MAGQRQDYLLRQIELLRQFVARLARSRSEPELEEALLLAFHLQEKLLPLPPAEFLALELTDQMTALARGRSPADASARQLEYATLLAETARLYDLKGREDLAAGARQMALYAALHVTPEADAAGGTAPALVEELAARLEGLELHAPVAALLGHYRSRAPS